MPSNVQAIIGFVQGGCHIFRAAGMQKESAPPAIFANGARGVSVRFRDRVGAVPACALAGAPLRVLPQLQRALANGVLVHPHHAHRLLRGVTAHQVAVVDTLVAGEVLGDRLRGDVGEDHARTRQFLDVGAERAQVAREDRLALA